MNDFDGYDFAAGEIYGLRHFNVDHLGRLHAVSMSDYVWTPGVNVATCLRPVAERAHTKACKAERAKKGREELTIPDPPQITYELGGYGGGGVARYTYQVPSASLSWGPSGSYTVTPSCGCPPKDAHGVLTDVKCPCGFYAYTNEDTASHYSGHVAGVIKGYGRTVVGTQGFRCEKAEVVALTVRQRAVRNPERIRERLGALYSVPVFAKRREMFAEFPITSDAGPTPESDPDFWTRP